MQTRAADVAPNLSVPIPVLVDVRKRMDVCRSVGKEPEPSPPPLAPEDEPSRTVAADLKQDLRVLLMARGFDPKADDVKRAIEEFVRAVVAQQE
jgi:hypothetical protein